MLQRMLQIVFWKAVDEEVGIGFQFGLAMQKFSNIEWFLHWKLKLNRSWKFRRNWKVPLVVLLERSWWAGFNGIYLVRYGIRMWEIFISKWFLPLKIQINSQKTRFWKEKSVEDMVTLGPTAQATLVIVEIWASSKPPTWMLSFARSGLHVLLSVLISFKPKGAYSDRCKSEL